ncbi:MAG TPA: hypothetical protein VK789_00140 [Bryobacteraceae bacterium]|jgi:hypothetical protein|nr:hypothetical protein [Bryobacteraceae bacterium]
MDRLSKTRLALIVILLAIIAPRPVFQPQIAEAARRYKYTVACGGCQTARPQTDDTLNYYAAREWKFVAAAPGQSPGNPS